MINETFCEISKVNFSGISNLDQETISVFNYYDTNNDSHFYGLTNTAST